jgi:hypothetical protein
MAKHGATEIQQLAFDAWGSSDTLRDAVVKLWPHVGTGVRRSAPWKAARAELALRESLKVLREAKRVHDDQVRQLQIEWQRRLEAMRKCIEGELSTIYCDLGNLQNNFLVGSCSATRDDEHDE